MLETIEDSALQEIRSREEEIALLESASAEGNFDHIQRILSSLTHHLSDTRNTYRTELMIALCFRLKPEDRIETLREILLRKLKENFKVKKDSLYAQALLECNEILGYLYTIREGMKKIENATQLTELACSAGRRNDLEFSNLTDMLGGIFDGDFVFPADWKEKIQQETERLIAFVETQRDKYRQERTTSP